MGLLNIIRRMHLRRKLSIREIARRTGLSRNTVTKHLVADTIEPKFATPERPSKLDPFADKLAGWLKAEAGKARKQRRTLKQMHADLVTLGFAGSYNRVAAFARQWRAERQRDQQTTGRGTFVPLLFRPGEAFQFDWSEDFAVPGWHLSRSGKATTAASALEHALISGFGTLGKVTREFLLRSDNGLVFTSRRYTALVRSYGLKQEFITPHCPQQNGMVERVIRTLKEQCIHRQRFDSIQHAIRAMGDWISFYNTRRRHQALDMKTPAEAFALAA